MDDISYTFSTALRMMRYGGKKMRSLEWNKEYSKCLRVNSDGAIVVHDIKNGNNIEYAHLGSRELMGSWIEVKE